MWSATGQRHFAIVYCGLQAAHLDQNPGEFGLFRFISLN